MTRRPRLRRAGLPRPDVGRARRDPAAGRGAPGRATSCARPAAARSPRSARRGSASRARSSSPLGDDAGRHRCCARCSPTRACAGPAGSWTRTPVTVIMPTDGDRAMATFDPGESVTAAELAAVEPRAVVLSIPRSAASRRRARACTSSVGDVDARALAGGELPDRAGRRRALLVNEREARLLTGAERRRGRGARARASARRCAIVTLGADGALAAGADGAVRVAGVAVEAVRHDRRRRPVRRRLRLGRPLGRGAGAAPALGGPVRIPLGEGRHRGRGRGDVEGALGGGR